MKKILTIALSIFLIFTLAACTGTVQNTNESGSAEPPVHIVYSDNFGFTKNEMTYLYQYVYDQGASYLTLMGLDPQTSLKEQAYDENQSWFDYLMDQAIYYAEDFLIFCEEAKKRGIQLDENDLSNVSAEIASIQDDAKNAGYKTADEYLKAIYGSNLTIAEYESFITKTTLAYKAYAVILSDIEISEDEIEAYYLDNANQLSVIDYLVYQFKGGHDSDMSTALALEKAELLGLAVTEAEFHEAVKKMDAELTIEDIEYNSIPYDENDAFLTWAFSEDAKVGATYVSSNLDDGIFTVYMLKKQPYRDESILVEDILTQQVYETLYADMLLNYYVTIQYERINEIEG
ncbi:MAG TPA: hypothetical protein DCS67_10005 [Clostridiales bacterium UBA8960]|nr:hypothetical protein [Clostridiales bacterium UBA8960]